MTVLRHVVIALLLAAAGGVCWVLGDTEYRVAGDEAALATLNNAAVPGPASGHAEPGSALPWVGRQLEATSLRLQTSAAYWQADYKALTTAAPTTGASATPAAQDPDVLFVTANAAYRALDVDGADRATVVQQLDRVIKRYAEVLQQRAHEDAAFNYEYLVRLRDTTAHGRGPVASIKPDLTGSTGSHPTVHGHVGGPPKGVEMQQFKVMVPKRSDERKEGLEPGKGAAKERKG
jgi:hypothetical protein